MTVVRWGGDGVVVVVRGWEEGGAVVESSMPATPTPTLPPQANYKLIPIPLLPWTLMATMCG